MFSTYATAASALLSQLKSDNEAAASAADSRRRRHRSKRDRNLDDDYKGEEVRNRVAIVTGANSGIGFAVAEKLLRLGMRVVVTARENYAGSVTATALSQRVPRSNVTFLKLDLNETQSIRDFAAAFKALKLPLHLLVNNAGTMLAPYSVNADGIETHCQVNFVGPFLLTHLLLDCLHISGTRAQWPARVVNVSSVVHTIPTRFAAELVHPLSSESAYDAYVAYAQSKLGLVLSTYAMARFITQRGLRIATSCVDPGIVFTRLYRHVGCIPQAALRLIGPQLMRNTQQGAAPIVKACTDVLLGGSQTGVYVNSAGRLEPSAPASYSEADQNIAWDLACELSGLADLTL